jgi:uncharacterized protein (TIGR01777 family)
VTPGRVLVTGASGLIGSALVPALEAGGASVLRLGRGAGPEPWRLTWNPDAGSIPRASLEGLDAVVHLAGESLAAGRWSPARKARLLGSRVGGTRLLCETLAALERPPRVMVSASATGFYGDRGSEVLNEESPPGSGFLAGLARAWEESTTVAEARGVRVVRLRIAPVLAPRGGMLAPLRLPFRLGLGGPLGSGRQWLSWIALDDLVAAIRHLLGHDAVRGAVNAAAPGAVTHREFARNLGRVLGRPAFMRVPAVVLRIILGEMADEALLASTRVEPRRLLESGFTFRYPELEPALRHVLIGLGPRRD